MDNRGYASKIVRANLAANENSPGVALGRFCIAKDIPVSDVASYFSVSRMTIYKWFVGEWAPRKANADRIWEMLKKAKFSV